MSEFTFDIRPDVNSPAVRQEPIVGRWYCHFESKKHADGTPYECDGNIGQYEGCGQFCDEDGADIEMSGDISSPWPSYLILQD